MESVIINFYIGWLLICVLIAGVISDTVIAYFSVEFRRLLRELGWSEEEAWLIYWREIKW
jgi:hypothetical protein